MKGWRGRLLDPPVGVNRHYDVCTERSDTLQRGGLDLRLEDLPIGSCLNADIKDALGGAIPKTSFRSGEVLDKPGESSDAPIWRARSRTQQLEARDVRAAMPQVPVGPSDLTREDEPLVAFKTREAPERPSARRGAGPSWFIALPKPLLAGRSSVGAR